MENILKKNKKKLPLSRRKKHKGNLKNLLYGRLEKSNTVSFFVLKIYIKFEKFGKCNRIINFLLLLQQVIQSIENVQLGSNDADLPTSRKYENNENEIDSSSQHILNT